MGSMEAETPTQARTWIEHSDTCICIYIYTQLQYICIIGTLGPALCIPNHCCPCCHGANGENMQDADAAAGAAVATVEIAALKRQFKLSEMSG